VFSEEEFEHWFLPQKNIIDSYVVEKDGVVTGTIIISIRFIEQETETVIYWF
jgi:hypothetical protein